MSDVKIPFVLYDAILVDRKQAKEKEGLLFIPEQAKEKLTEGLVVATGCGRLLPDGSVKKLIVNVGDRIMYEKYAGHEFKIGDKEVVRIKEDDVLCVF